MKKCLRGSGVSVSLLLLAGAITGCVEEPSPFNPRAMQQWERDNDGQVRRRPLYPLSGTSETTYVPGESEPRMNHFNDGRNVPEGPPIKMSLQEIIHRAVANSLDIRVAGFDTAVDQTRVMEAEGQFDPTFFTGFNFERVDKQSPGTFSNFDTVFNNTTRLATFNQSDTSTFQVGIRQTTEIGSKVEIKYQVQNTWSNPQQFPINPFYENDLILTITQPLLQNFGTEVNRARIDISRNNQRVSLLDFRKTVEDTVLKLEQLYWQLQQAERDIVTLEKVVAASEETTGVLSRRQQQDVTAVQITQANAETASRRASLDLARAQLGDLSDQIKQLMNDPQFPVAAAGVITPADDELIEPLHFDLDDQIATALENRLELGQQQVRITSAEIAMKVAKNNLLPSLNLQGSVTSDGVGRSLSDSISSQTNFDRFGYSIGLQLEIPIGNRSAHAIWQRALLQREQAIMSYGNLIEKVSQEVKTAARAVDTQWVQVRDWHNARLLAQSALDELQKQQDAAAAPLTPEAVQLKLDRQRTLAQNEEQEHAAVAAYNFAIATLEKSKGTILRYNNVILEEKQLPFAMHPGKEWGR